MPRTWMQCGPGLAAGLLALATGCPGPKGNTNNTAKSPQGAPAPALALRIETTRGAYEPWETGMASLVVDNKGQHPVVIREAMLETSGGVSILAESTVQRFPSAITLDPLTGEFASLLAIEGVYLEDNPGAAARAPAPPRWEFRGEGELATFSVLPPGASRRWAGTFRARYDAGDELRARVRFTTIHDNDFEYYAMEKDDVKDVPPEGGAMESRGMAPAVRVHVTYKKVAGVPERAGEVTPPSAPTVIPFTPFGFALPSQAFDALATDEVDSTAPLQIERFPFDIDAARAAADVPAGPYTRALAAEMWVLGGEAVTYLVSADRVIECGGNAIPLADALNEERKRDITLYRGASKPDEPGHLAYFSQKGFRTRENQEKDGSFTGRLTLAGRELPTFLQALDARGLTMKNADAVE